MQGTTDVSSAFLHPVDTKMLGRYARADSCIETFAVVADPELEIILINQ